MDFRDFLVLAKAWSKGRTEGERRSAVSRAYYAAFHVAARLLADSGFRVPLADRARFPVGRSSWEPCHILQDITFVCL